MFVQKRITGLLVLMAMIVVLTVAGSLSVFAQSAKGTQTMEKSIAVELNDDYFNPKDIAIPAGTTTTLLLKNKGAKEHTFTVKELGIDVEIAPGKETTISVEPKQPGTYELICKYHYQRGMVGTVTVR